MLSTELRLALGPAATYAALLRERSDSRWWQVLRPPAHYALLVGALIAMLSTGRVTIGLVLTVAVSWAFVLPIQAFAAAVVIVPARGRDVTLGRAFELLFLGHAPWSLWLLAVTLVIMVVRPAMSLAVLLTMIIPAGWTMVILSAFCQRVLGATRQAARGYAMLHQAVIWTCFFVYVAFAAGGWARVLEVLGL
jgi:hypothetical protein